MEFAELFYSLPAEIIQHHVVTQLDSATLVSCRAAFGLKYCIDDLTIHHGVLHGTTFIKWMAQTTQPSSIFLHACAQGIYMTSDNTAGVRFNQDGLAIAAAYGHDKIVVKLLPFSNQIHITDAVNMALMQGHKHVLDLLKPQCITAVGQMCAVLSSSYELVSSLRLGRNVYSTILCNAVDTTRWLLQRFENYRIVQRMELAGLTTFAEVEPFAVVFGSNSANVDLVKILAIACLFDRFDLQDTVLASLIAYPVALWHITMIISQTLTHCSLPVWQWAWSHGLMDVDKTFYALVMSGRATRAKLLIEHLPLENQQTAVIRILQSRATKLSLADELVATGVNPNLILAEGARTGCERICRTAMNAGAVVVDSILQAAINTGNFPTVYYLCEFVATTPPDTIKWAIVSNHSHLLPYLLSRSPATEEDFITAVEAGNKNCIYALLQTGLPDLDVLLAAAPRRLHGFIGSFYQQV